MGRHLLAFLSLALFTTSCAENSRMGANEQKHSQLDELSALWSFYKFAYIKDGRVISLDEKGITTSEGQSYAMLRAVWSNDRPAFESVWSWTRQHLQKREDNLFAWKWKDKVLDSNSATDADTDVALALILASRRFSNSRYLEDAQAILDDIWAKEVVRVKDQCFLTAGNWAPAEKYPTIHPAYFAPYAYEVFSGIDQRHPWAALVRSSYDVLHWLYFTKKVSVPPEIIYLDQRTGELLLKASEPAPRSEFGYDSVPLFWRISLDARWFGRSESKLRQRMLQFFETEWKAKRKIFDRYTLEGESISALEGLPHLATIHSLALIEGSDVADAIRSEKLDGLWAKALVGEDTPYYLHNWLWFDRAFELQIPRHFDEFLGFLRPFDFAGFSANLPWVLFAIALILFPLSRVHWLFKAGFLICAFGLCFRYLGWRLFQTLNFKETLGPFISIALWLAELYSFSTVALLLLQVGIRPRKRTSVASTMPKLTVDIFVPIYSESLEILEKTLTAAQAIRYESKRVYVLDDSHRESVQQLAKEHGATYIQGPKKHAKAGNLNHALTKSSGELIVVFDTDHIPTESFLEETVPYFSDELVGFVQTPHHFYNQDIFQRAFQVGAAVPNEQDMFNHAIQGGRDSWGGAFFVGSGAVFRRRAIEQVGGFNLLSITEDIHTSQKLHAAGWRSVFVDKDLAVGLTAENLVSYIVQRRRWMLGCLQIFFKDNPLFSRGMGLRHRVGYFASLYYFFFPLGRAVFWITPLYFLLFHLHPLFADVSVLLAYLLPYMVVLPMVATVLLPGWPRMLWGVVYEMAVSLPLFRAMFDLMLPKRLGFKVTPKGIIATKRTFDFSSTKLTWFAAGVTIFAIVKGVFEFNYFGIEKDAYFINLGWAIYNLGFLAIALLIAWERPQRRAEERVAKVLPIRLEAEGLRLDVQTTEMSLSGLSFVTDRHHEIPRDLQVVIASLDGMRLRARVIYNDKLSRSRFRCGLHFVDVPAESRRVLIRKLFADSETWKTSHQNRSRSNFVIAFSLIAGLARCFRPLRTRTRLRPRRRTFQSLRLVHQGGACTVLLENISAGGFRVLSVGTRPPVGDRLLILGVHDRPQWVRIVYQNKILPGVYRTGMEIVPGELTDSPRAYLAA